ncbi:hypothetical protein [Bacillus infantis]|uniref:hypothetical protein n=1 Tax=Bacillus infantis TaxID=324767 RepID=UPI00209E08FC|nr:hypothetical protein [Bacillus infantis]MCP1159327.1 hypothetical protein [Bacillus infantis]
MSYYNEEDFYHEPSEFEMMVEDLKNSLLKSVKEEYVIEMEKLRKENQDLQEVKRNFEKIKNDFENKKRDLYIEYETKKSQVRRERLSELMKDCEVELFSVASKPKFKPKCDNCDEKRRIYYKTPSGRETYEACNCASTLSIYEPIQTILSSFSIRNGEGSAWYQIKDRGQYDEYLHYYDDSVSGNQLITDEKQFDGITSTYKTLFKTEELAQKFCDLKNSEVVEVSRNPVMKKS